MDHKADLMPTIIAIAVVEHDDRFLIGQRPAEVALAGYWEFPGGKVEPDESPADAAVRECLEETGLHVSVVGEYPTTRHQYDHDTVVLNFYRCVPATIANEPHAPFRWVTRQNLSEHSFPAGNDGLLELLTQPNRSNP
ncbi:MAG: ADP-ribose pyrophosphatase [Planctomycetaceae bacterium]|nr:ADP-ribose pyrophosphatase [Planctomycetaceae bacterium]